MMAAIEAQYTGEITVDEVVSTMALIKSGHYALPQMRGGLQGFAWMQAATWQELDEVLAALQPQLDRAMQQLESANRSRPGYAPAGRLTRSQEGAKIEAQQLARIVRCLTHKRNVRRAKAGQ